MAGNSATTPTAGAALSSAARYYDPVAGRWLTRDPIGYRGGLNLYGYCNNDPVNAVDPEGHFWHILIGAGIGAVGGGVMNCIAHGWSWSNFGDGAWKGALIGAVGAATGGACAEAAVMALGLEGTAAGAVVAGVVGGAAGDFCAQAFSVGMGWQQSIDYKQVAISGAIGGILGYGAYRFFKWCPWGCFIADTPIATPYGPIAIAQITDRDPVWAYDSDGRRTDPLLVPRLTSATYRIALTVDDIAAPADGTVRTPGNHDLVGVLDDDLVLQYGQPLGTVVPGTHVCFQGKVYIVLAGPFPGTLALVDTGTVLRKVARTFVHPAAKLVDLTIHDTSGKTTTVTGTPNHPFYVPALCGYVPMGELAPGMVLQTTNGSATVETVQMRACESAVYNFEVEEAHNYYVADLRVLVHNNCGSETNGPAVNLEEGTGAYDDVAGHHLHAKSAFRDHVSYDPDQGFCVSQKYMEMRGWSHQAMTSAQHRLFNELAASGRANTLAEHTEIAIKALMAGNATEEEARELVELSLKNLFDQGVTAPTRIPWN